MVLIAGHPDIHARSFQALLVDMVKYMGDRVFIQRGIAQPIRAGIVQLMTRHQPVKGGVLPGNGGGDTWASNRPST